MLGILTNGNIHMAIVVGRRRNYFARTFGVRVLDEIALLILLIFLGHTVIFPMSLEETITILVLLKTRFKCIKHPIPAPKENRVLALHFTFGRARPITMEYPLANAFGFLTSQSAIYFIQRNNTGSIGARNILMTPVLPIGSSAKEQVPVN